MSFAIIPGGFCTTCLQSGASLYKATQRNKPLMLTCISRLHSTSHHTASCWVSVARADINQQVSTVVSKHHFGSCISRAFLLLAPDWEHRQPRDFHCVLQLMLQKWRWSGVAWKQAAGVLHLWDLKPPIASGIKGLILCPILRMKRQQFTSSTMQHKLGLFKNIVSSGLDWSISFFSEAPDFITFKMQVATKAPNTFLWTPRCPTVLYPCRNMLCT